MKKKIFSVLGILILGLNTVFCQAVSVSLEDFAKQNVRNKELDSQDGEFYIDDEESLQDTQESFNEEENILEDDEEILIINSSSNFQESSLEAKMRIIFKNLELIYSTQGMRIFLRIFLFLRI